MGTGNSSRVHIAFGDIIPSFVKVYVFVVFSRATDTVMELSQELKSTFGADFTGAINTVACL